MPETAVNSFVVRFVEEQPTSLGVETTAWHGVIRHVQSRTELRFVDIHDAIRFMNSYVNIGGSLDRAELEES